MANQKKYQVNTLFRVTEDTAQAAISDNSNWPGVPFRFFQTIIEKNTPVYDPGTFTILTNLDSSIKDYLMPGSIVKLISNIAVTGPDGNKIINQDYILVRLVYARSAEEYEVPETGEIVYPELATQLAGGTGDMYYINEYVGIINKKYLEGFVMDPSIYEELQAKDKKSEVIKQLEKQINSKPTYTLKNLKQFWWLPITKDQTHRSKKSFNRDTLIKQYPDEGIVWDSNKEYKVKIMEYATYSDETAACGEKPSTQCPLALVAVIDAEKPHNFAHNWSNVDDPSTHFPQSDNPQEKITPYAHWGYISYSILLAQLGTNPPVVPSIPPTTSPSTPPPDPSTPPTRYNLESAEDFIKDEKKCRYFVKIKATYKGTNEQLKNDNLFNAAVKQEAFSKLLQNYNKIGAFEPFIWMNKDSGSTLYKEKDKKLLNEAFSKMEIQEKKKVDGPNNKVIVLLSVSALLFDKIPDGPSLKPYTKSNATDLQCILFTKKVGPSFDDIVTGAKDPKNYITTRFSLSDIEEMGNIFVNVFHRRYSSEYMKYVDLIYVDFQMESDYILKFTSGLKKLAKDNNLDIISSPAKHSHFNIIFDKNYLIKDIIYNKQTPINGTYYQFKNGLEEFKSKNNNRSTNKLIYDLCRASAVNDPAWPRSQVIEPAAVKSQTAGINLRTSFLKHMQTLHKTWSSPPSSECLARYTGKQTFDPVPIIFNNNDFFNQHYLEPRPKIKMKSKPSVPSTGEEFTEIARFRLGPKSPLDRAKEDKTINALIKREGKNLSKTKGSIFSAETNKFVGDIVKSKSIFNMILRSETFFGPKGLYQQLLNKTNISVWLKSVFECAGYDLKGDDLFEVLCNIVLKNLPWDKIRDEVLMNLNEATGEVTEWTTKALEDIYSEISTKDFDLNKATTGLGDVLRFADPKWYPGFDKTTQLYNALNMGSTPVGTPQPGSSLGGKTPSVKCSDIDDDQVLSMIPGAQIDSTTPEDEIPYLATPEDKGTNKNVYSSGDSVYKWKVFLNYKLSTAPPDKLPGVIQYAFTEEDFKKHGSLFDAKTKLATEKYSQIYRWGFHSLLKDKLGIQGIVSLEAFRDAAKWWAITPRQERDKYISTIIPGTVQSTSRITSDNLQKLLEEMPGKFGISPATVTQLLNNHYLAIKKVITQRNISGTPTITAMVTLALISKSTMVPAVTSQNIILAELMMSPAANSEQAIHSKIKSFIATLKPNLETALKNLGIIDYVIEELPEEIIKSTNFDQMVSDTNSETGEVVKYQSFLSQPQVPADFQSWKNQLNGYIAAGAFSKEGQIRLVTRLCANYNLQLSTLVTSHCNPEFLCKHLEKYILDLMSFFKTGDLSKIGLGKVTNFFKNFKIDDPLGTLGKLWVAAILKQIDQSLLQTFKWLARYIQLNCELMMSEAGKAVMTEINKLDDGAAKDFAKFGVGLFNLDTEPDPEEAENIIEIAFPSVVTTSPIENQDLYEFEGVDKFRIEDDQYDKIDVNKTKILREARRFVEILKPKDKEVVELALGELQSFLYKVLLSYSSKKLVVLFSGNATTALLEEMLILIEEKYPSLNKVLDSTQSINSFFNFVGASVDLELFINSIVSRKIIEDSCDIKDMSEDLQILSSKAILALEEQNRIRNEYISKIADLAIDNGALSGEPNPLGIDHALVPYPDSIPFLDNAMATARDSIMDSVEMSYRYDIKNIRSIFMKFNVTLQDKETGKVYDGFSALAGSLDPGEKASDAFDNYLNALADYVNKGSADIGFGDENYKVTMDFEDELYPELQAGLRGEKENSIERVYKIAGVNNPSSPKEQKLDIFPYLDFSPWSFNAFYHTYIEPKNADGPLESKPNANFAFVMGINTIEDPVDAPEDEYGLYTMNYATYVVLDPFKNHATMTSVITDAVDGKYTTAVINNENVMFSWKSGLYTNPAEIFGTEKVQTFSYGDPCSLEDLTIPYDIFEEVNFKDQTDDAFPEIKDPLLGNIAENLPLDLKDFGAFANTLPQARMFSKYVLNIFYKNIFEQRRGIYTSPPDDIIESIEKVKSILETYVFSRVTNNLIRAFGEYTSYSKFFDTKEVYKLTETLCDPAKIPFDLIDLEKIKEDVVKRYAYHRKKLLIEEQTNEESELEPASSNGAFELAMMEGTVRLILRTYLAEMLLRSVFLFDRYVFEEIMDNDMFKELFARQFLIGIQTYVGDQDPEIFRAMFLTECRHLAKSRWSSLSPNQKKYSKNKVLNDETTLIKHLISLEINDMGAKINSLFSLGNEKIKPLKEIFFDDLKFGFLRNSGINFGQDTTPRSYFMLDYLDEEVTSPPVSSMASKSEFEIDLYKGAVGDPALRKVMYFDANGNEIDFETFPYDNTKDYKLGFGEFVIEPYVRLVDWEVGEQEGNPAQEPNDNFPLTMFDQAFGPDGVLESAYGIKGYLRRDTQRGILSLRGLKDFAIDLIEHLHAQSAEDIGADDAELVLNDFGKHILPLTTFYKEMKWGIRLNLLIPADPFSGEGDIPFQKLEEHFNKFFDAAAFENKWTPAVHKSYRIYRQVKDEKGKATGKKVPHFVIPLTYEEIEATSIGEGTGLVGFATDLHNQSFKDIADVKEKIYNLQIARYIKYPSDEDVYKIKFNMGYRDPAYKQFEEGTTPGSILPLVIHSEASLDNNTKGDFDGTTSVEDELVTGYFGEKYGRAAEFIANYAHDKDNEGLTSLMLGNNLSMMASYAKQINDAGADANDWLTSFDLYASAKGSSRTEAMSDVWNAYNTLLGTKYDRNKFAQWMGIGVELDEEPYARTQTKVNSLKRDTNRKDYNPEKTPGLIGKPDYNAKFIIDYDYGDKGSYPHGATDDLGCKKFGTKAYELLFKTAGATGYLKASHIQTMYQAAAADGIGGGFDQIDFYDEEGNYDFTPLYDTNFKNMSMYKMTRCKKSPSWKQTGATYPGGEQISAIEEWKPGGQKQPVSPIKVSINDVYPIQQYHWSQISTDNQEVFLEKILKLAGDFSYTKSALNECIDIHLPGWDPEQAFDSKEKFQEWKENNKENIEAFFECTNEKLSVTNTQFENIYKEVDYKHPGGMPLPVKVQTGLLAQEGYDTLLTDLSQPGTNKRNKICLHTGIFTNQVFKDYTQTSLYGVNPEQDKKLEVFYNLNEDNKDTDILSPSSANPGVAALLAEYAPHSDNINISMQGSEGLYWESTGVKMYGYYWGSYLAWTPGYHTFSGLVDGHNIPDQGPAGSLEPSQIWVKNANSIDFRELANKKTDYLLERSGFMPPYYAGYKEPLSLGFGVEKEFPIFDAVSHTYKDQDADDAGIQSKSSMVEVLRSDTDVYIDDMSGNWHDNENIKDLPKTPSDRLKYPRSKLDVWRMIIKKPFGQDFGPNAEPTEEDIFSGNVRVKTSKYVKTPNGEVKKVVDDKELKINEDMLMSYQNDMFRISNDPNNDPAYPKLEDQTPLFLDDDNTWGGDVYVGLFPDQNDLQKLKQLFQGLHVYKGSKLIKDILGDTFNINPGSKKLNDWVEVDLVTNALDDWDESGAGAVIAKEIKSMLVGDATNDYSYQASKSLINPFIINEPTQLNPVYGNKWSKATKEFLSNLSSVQDLLKLSDLYYISAGLFNDPVSSGLYEAGPPLDNNSLAGHLYTGEYENLPPALKQFYTKTVSDDQLINGKAAIELKVKMKKTDYMTYSGDPLYENLYFDTLPDDKGLISFNIKLYQVRLRSANVLKLGDIEFGSKMQIEEIIQENDSSVFIREFFVGDIGKKQQQEKAGNFGEITSIYDYLKDKMINGPDGNGSKQFQLLFNYIFPIKQYASFVAVYTMFYSLYKKGTAFDTNEKMKHLFTNTKIDLFDLFHLLTAGGDPYKRFGLSNLEQTVLSERQAETFKQFGSKGLTALQEKQKQILDQIRAEGLEPGFFAPFTQKDHSGLAHDNIRMIFEILAEMVDPGFDTFPITPFGWIALLLRRQSRSLAGKEPDLIAGEFIDPTDPDLCKDE